MSKMWHCLLGAVGWFIAWSPGLGQVLSPPVFVQEPANRTASVGTTVTLFCNATGSLPIFYQWRFNETVLPGATNRFLSLQNLRMEDAGSYRVSASNAAGFALSSNATLTVTQQPPTLTGQPASKQGVVGSTVSISVAAVGSLPLYFQWKFNNADLPGATNATLTLAVSSRAQEGEYRVEVRNAFGSVLSSAAFLTITDLQKALDADSLIWDSAGSPGWLPETSIHHDGVDAAFSGMVPYLAQSRLSTTIIGPGRLSFWWLNAAVTPAPVLWVQSDGVVLAAAAPVLGWQPVTVYVGENVHELDWICAGVRSGTTASGWLDEVSYQPGPTPATLVSAVIEMAVLAGADPVLSVEAEGTPPLSFQWSFNEQPIAGATGSRLRLTNVQAAASGRYEVTVANSSGPATSAAGELTVTPSAPTLTTLPVTQRVLLRRDAVFAAEGRGTEPLQYEWTHDGVSLGGATNRTLVRQSVGSNDLGRYEVTVRNGLGVSAASAFLLPQFSALVAWGANNQGQTAIPSDIYDLQVFAGGPGYTAATRADGRLALWGSFPTAAPLSFPAALAAGTRHMLVLTFEGRVMGVSGASVPAGLAGVVALAAGADLSMALLGDGRLSLWGAGSLELRNFASGLSHITAIACGRHHALALKSDSHVVAWGPDFYGDTIVPAGLDGVVAIACGAFHSMALKGDGTVTCWGYNEFGQCNPPPDLGRVIAIAGGLEHSMALRQDGTVVVWGGNSAGQREIPAVVSNAIAIASGEMHCLALLNDGSPYPVMAGRGQSVPTGALVSFGTLWAGAQPLSYQWQRNGIDLPGATEAAFVLEEATLADAGDYRCLARNEFGSWLGPLYQLAVERTTPRFGASLFGLQFSEGGLGLEINDLSGHGVMVLYASSNLMQWEPIYTNPTPVLGTVRVLDADALKLPRRFYRAVEQ
jgi:hypothetical protein